MDTIFIVANVFSTIACVVMVAIGFLKKKDHIVLGQCVQLGFLGISNFMLGAVAGGIGNALGVIRNLVLPKVAKPLYWKVGFIAVQLVLTLLTWDYVTWVAWIPFMYAVILTCVLDTKSVTVFKVAIIIAQALFCLYDWHYKNMGGMAANVLTIASNTISIIVEHKKAAKASA
ncbi:MAG: YgjV family protein [Oscillospiraceae bacterium]|nr:YgjV family protein [Oscillospiraceae bacterium]